MKTEITTYYLEMKDPKNLSPARSHVDGLRIEKVARPKPDLNRILYEAVGKDWYWTDRLAWTKDQWREYVDRPVLVTWIAHVSTKIAGYFELEKQPGSSVEIAYFGLLPNFIGRGIGGHLLTAAIQQAWAMGASRVWVHTCTLDHPNALSNYKARGLKVVRQTSEYKNLSDKVSKGPRYSEERVRQRIH